MQAVSRWVLGGLVLGLPSLATQISPPRSFVAVTVASADLEISCEASGLIAEMSVVEGQRVRRGELLFRLTTAEERLEVARLRLEAGSQAELQAARAELRLAEGVELRHRDLHRRGITGDADWEVYQREAELARIKVKRALTNQQITRLRHQEAEARLRARSVHSPIAGTVVKRLHAPGEAVERWTPVLQLLSTEPLWVDFDCPVADRSMFAPGQEMRVRQIGQAASARATVVHRSARVDAASQTLRVRLQLTKVDPAWPAGLKVEVLPGS